MSAECDFSFLSLQEVVPNFKLFTRELGKRHFWSHLVPSEPLCRRPKPSNKTFARYQSILTALFYDYPVPDVKRDRRCDLLCSAACIVLNIRKSTISSRPSTARCQCIVMFRLWRDPVWVLARGRLPDGVWPPSWMRRSKRLNREQPLSKV